MSEVFVNLGDRSYSIFIESQGFLKLSLIMEELNLGKHAAVISDETVSRLYGNRVLETLRRNGIACDLHVVPDGEGSKSLDRASWIYTQLIESKLRRDGVIIALGGGVIGDLAGFIAATYLRGVKWVQVPTTLLAQVDSSVGGKVGINHPYGKNLIGSFYQPQFVLIDPGVLSTLENREIWAGLGEVLKYGLIRDEELLRSLEENLNSIVELTDENLIAELITTCCGIKAQIVEQDEKEGDLRRVLNFGHTLGHALEAETQFKYFRHGEAVVYGLYWASYVSLVKGYLSEPIFHRIETLIRRFPIPDLPDGLKPDRLESRIGSDKKQAREGLDLILLKNIGSTAIEKVTSVSDKIEGWLDYIKG